ncbi:HlyD family type I secretion periplasmic adaptor subunit [Bradyrhizobium sp. AUGA SZCCT0222]|uniref:HlyD family type I secretion periplasmic adaptor subunit n=1 Tax=Bradyrhizobium sp. AUGA SZCCT0222 TaxID=2807668 RepID=UPI001BA85059|nr:HlyD family type I secretion periplasmic adaptor subunit [Bradyrhizobium sp. AUGA SZCCT0222]MBR1270092.1 HlyD family type I secretion periplasmic adaptor subunit [Bradyrhizobium sp. AUGA SZCCT0222]
MMAWLAGRFPTLAKHWAVLRTSWGMQNEADRNKRPISDHEFLPAALEIMEKPASPGLRMLLLMTCAFFTAGLVWSIIGTVDVVAVASGKIIPSSKVKTIQPMEIGQVRAIHVTNGQHVEEGQPLVELDPTLATADESQARQNLLASRLVHARNAALLAYLDGHPTSFAAPEDAPPATVAVEEQFVRTSIAEYEAQIASLRQQIAQRAAELASTEVEIHKLRLTLPLVDQSLEARRKLTDQGNYARLKLLEYEQQRIEHIQNIDVQLANTVKARAAMSSLEAEIRKLRETFGKTAVSELVQARDKAQLAAEELRKTTRRREFLQLRAPVTGTVQQLAVTTIGGVVQPAQALMIIVPDGAEIEVEAHVLNKDIGFIREGQPVRVKLEAFPFTDHGLVPGIVEGISRDAIDLSQSQSNGPQRDEKNRPIQPGLVYAARIRLLETSIRVRDRKQALGPGLSVQAEIKTGQRRVIQYLLSPIMQALDEAGRER